MLLQVEAVFGETSPGQLSVGKAKMVIFWLVSRDITLVAWNVEVLLGSRCSLLFHINTLEAYPVTHVIVACAIHVDISPFVEDALLNLPVCRYGSKMLRALELVLVV